MAGFDRHRLQSAVLASMVGEVDALKPGNVHRFAAGHGMTYEDFVTSAECSAPCLCEPGVLLGRRVLNAITATRAAVSVNTNLGIVLLQAPLICAAERAKDPSRLRRALAETLGALHKNDTEDVFSAIRLARPGGLGHTEEYDVHSSADCRLLDAMAAAAGRDMVARQYAFGFEDIYAVGLAALHEYFDRWNSVEWATVACYLRFLTRFPDSHVLRNFGPEVADEIRVRSGPVFRRFDNYKKPGSAITMLLEYDKELKDANINPGTSADLTAASLLLFHLGA